VPAALDPITRDLGVDTSVPLAANSIATSVALAIHEERANPACRRLGYDLVVSTLLIVTKADGSLWQPTRNARLRAWALMKKLHPNAYIFERVVATKDRSDDLMWWLKGRRGGAATTGGPEGGGLTGINRFEEEGYILAFDAKLKLDGKPAMSVRQHVAFRRAGANYDECLGLDVKTELFEVWEQCAARWHGREPRRIPQSVKLIMTGSRNLEAIEEDVAALLQEDVYLRRHGHLPTSLLPTLHQTVIKQWVVASGGIQRHLDVVDRMLGQNKDHRLLHLAEAGGYSKLAPEMVDLALHVAEGDARLAFFAFRCMQRVAACAVEGEVMWIAEWLRGPNANPHAIPGTTGKPKLVEIMQNHILGEVTKGHSGAAAIPTTYRVKAQIAVGSCGPGEAAQRLGIILNAKGLPRR
jgi:hypothetical protein